MYSKPKASAMEERSVFTSQVPAGALCAAFTLPSIYFCLPPLTLCFPVNRWFGLTGTR
jgi:hypothetical protein